MELDYDLEACLTHNTQEGYNADDIAEVLAVWEGENEGDDWRWILRLNDGRFVFLQGGCDFTGWDCQSYAVSAFAGLPDVLLIIEEQGDHKDRADVIASLRQQLIEGKAKTWHETKGDEFGNPPFVD